MKKSYRWIVLGAYSFVACLSQLLWLNFAPILTQVETKYLITESQASLLILVFPLVYVLLSIPSGAFIDRYGYKKGIGLGVVIMAVFTCLRVVDDYFYVILVAQVGIAVGQPFIINGITKLILDWFPGEQTALATGLGTMGMFVGMAAGMALTPVLLSQYGFHGTMVAYALLTLGTGAFFILVRSNPHTPEAETGSLESSFEVFKALLRDRNILVLLVLSFLGLGFFNGLTTWLELILAPHGITSEQAGIAGGVLIVGGIVGAGIIPALSDLFKKRKPFLVASIVMAVFTLYPLCRGESYGRVLFFSALQGFFFLPAFSLLLEMCADLVGAKRSASATSLLMLTGNAGGVIVIMAMEWVKTGSQDFGPAVNLMFALLVLSLGLSFVLPETRYR